MGEYFLSFDPYNFNTEEEFYNYIWGDDDNNELDAISGDVLEKKRQL